MIRITFYRPRIFTREFWRHWKQRRKQGFIDEDTYGLYKPIAEFVLPRLRCFRYQVFGQHFERMPSLPRSHWCRTVDKMIWSMNEIVENDGWYQGKEIFDPIESARLRRIYDKKLQEGLTLFGRNFCGLWW